MIHSDVGKSALKLCVGEMNITFYPCSLFRPQLPPVELMPTPYHTLSWLGPPCASRTHKNTFTRLGMDDQPATQVIFKTVSVFLAFC